MLWQKDTRAADWVTRFTVGEDYRWDTLLLPFDIEGTRAHAWGLTQIQVLTQDELARINVQLDRLRGLVEAGEVVVTPEDEDCHTVIEQFLTAELGETGKKIHTGRSRNDQVLTALRLFLRQQIQWVGSQTMALVEQLCRMAERLDTLILPGYTHFQRAMPSTVGLWAMGFAELLATDLDTLELAYHQVNVSPLGSAAGYGVPFLKLPREAVAERLGFEAVQTHVTAVQLSRGKMELAMVHALVQMGATLNRLASELILFNTSEFGFVKLPAEYCTGSSIMPQKQNPDVLELARATYHRLLAEMNLLLTLPANLPSGYHRDLQLTKESAMRSVLLAQDLMRAMLHLLPGVTFREEALREAVSPDLYATAYALESVLQGMPFRDAYRQAARQLETLQPPDTDKALASYLADGFPGHCRPDLILARIEKHTAWTGQ